MEVLAVVFFLVVYLALCAVCLVNYVLTSLSTMQLADVLGVKNAWLAWIPIGNFYVMGATADQLEAKRGVSHKWGKLLLILGLIVVALFFLMFVALFALIAYIGVAEATGEFYNEGILIAPAIFVYLGYIVVMIVVMALSYLTAVCIYKIFEEIVPQKSIKYFLLFVLVPFGNVFCFFRCKKLVEDELLAQRAEQKAAEQESAAPISEIADDTALAFGYDVAAVQEEKTEEEKTEEESNNENDQQ